MSRRELLIEEAEKMEPRLPKTPPAMQARIAKLEEVLKRVDLMIRASGYQNHLLQDDSNYCRPVFPGIVYRLMRAALEGR